MKFQIEHMRRGQTAPPKEHSLPQRVSSRITDELHREFPPSPDSPFTGAGQIFFTHPPGGSPMTEQQQATETVPPVQFTLSSAALEIETLIRARYPLIGILSWRKSA